MTKKKKAILIIVLIVVVLGICAGTFLYFKDKEEQKKKLIREEKALVEKIKNSYSKYVVVSNAFLYKKIDNNYSKIMKVSAEKEFTLKDTKIDKNTKYFLIDELGYYVRYQDVSKMDKLTAKDLRYKNYLPFNYNVVTNDKVTLYQDDKAIYELYYSLDTPVIELDDSGYIIEFNDEEYLVKKEDVLKHPTWKMSEKITVDSATLVNKGYEVIEASVLFDFPLNKVGAFICRESLIHAKIDYCDKGEKEEIWRISSFSNVVYSLNIDKRLL